MTLFVCNCRVNQGFRGSPTTVLPAAPWRAWALPSICLYIDLLYNTSNHAILVPRIVWRLLWARRAAGFRSLEIILIIRKQRPGRKMSINKQHSAKPSIFPVKINSDEAESQWLWSICVTCCSINRVGYISGDLQGWSMLTHAKNRAVYMCSTCVISNWMELGSI